MYWHWYCDARGQDGVSAASFIRSLMTGWIPSLLLNLWLVLVLPRLVYLLAQAEVAEMCDRFLTNPVIEDAVITVTEAAGV